VLIESVVAPSEGGLADPLNEYHFSLAKLNFVLHILEDIMKYLAALFFLFVLFDLSCVTDF
jgi:hypothetical protein